MKRIISLVLIMVIICLSISPALADEGEEPVSYPVNESVMAYYIWLMLSSWGITIGTTSPATYNPTVEEKIIDWVMQYLAELPSAYTISTWIAPWQASMDYWGNFQGNSSMLEDVEDFGEWLVDFLSLTDDEVHIVDPVVSLDGITLYDYGTNYQCISVNGNPYYVYMWINARNGSPLPIHWFVSYNTDTEDYYINHISYSETAFLFQFKIYDGSGVELSAGGGTVRTYGPNAHGYSASLNNAITAIGAIPSGCVYYSGDQDEIAAWWQNAQITTIGDLKVLTSTIVLPSDDPAYTPGDSITIIDDQPEYQVINFPDNLKVSNLPAIISEGTVPDPQFAGVFAPVSALISAMVPAITIVQGIAFELPDIMITFFLAMCGCLIFFGFVRKMME